MSIPVAVVAAVVGLVGLTGGAEWLVRGSSRIATYFGVSPLVIGLTVVAYGTSAPEIVASLVAGLQGHPEVTVGNVVGSNIANMGLILGFAAVLAPFAVPPSVLRREVPIMVLVTILFYVLALQLEFSRVTGAAFLVLLVLFNVLSLRWGRADGAELGEDVRPRDGLVRGLVLTLGGLLVLLVSAHFLVQGAVTLARWAGLSEFIIGVTLVAVGTSLPELATSVIAGLRKETDLIVGNIVGSNLFNILGALGVSALVKPVAIDESLLGFEFIALVVITLLTTLFLFTGKRLTRMEGIGLLASYATFITVLFL